MDIMTRLRSQWDRLTAGACAVAGVIVLTMGWFGVGGTAYPAEQLPYIISAGLGGLFLLGISAVLWLSADLHDEWRKLDRIEQAIRSASADEALPDVGPETDHQPERATAAAPKTRILPAVATEGA